MMEMKKNFNIFIVILFIGIGFASCKNDGSDIPIPATDLKAYSGKYRAKIKFAVSSDAKRGKVFYGTGNFKEFTVTDPTTLQDVIIDDLPEGELRVRIVTINADGLVSDPKSVLVNVYGANYENALKPRLWIDQVTNSATSLQFIFDNAVTTETGVRVVYTDTGGNKDSVFMSSSQNIIEVNNIDTTKVYYYYSVYKPNTESIDEFLSTSLDLKQMLMMDFKKDLWTIDASSSEDLDGMGANIIDNNDNSAWRPKNVGLPWITIDMGSPKIINGFYYVKKPENNNGPTKIKFEVSSDKTNWTTVLETDVKQSYLRQQLPLSNSVTARYVKLTIVSTINTTATQTEIAEIDAYNTVNISANNGYIQSTSIALVNAKEPFTGDGSDLFPAVGAGRMQKVFVWTHSSNAYISFDNAYGVFQPFTAPAWGVSEVINGKIYQKVSLDPGHYIVKFTSGSADGPLNIFGVASTGDALPDFTAVSTSANTIAYVNLLENQNSSVERLFILNNSISVNIGIVFNLYNALPVTGNAWTNFTLKRFELYKVER